MSAGALGERHRHCGLGSMCAAAGGGWGTVEQLCLLSFASGNEAWEGCKPTETAASTKLNDRYGDSWPSRAVVCRGACWLAPLALHYPWFFSVSLLFSCQLCDVKTLRLRFILACTSLVSCRWCTCKIEYINCCVRRYK